MSKVTRSNPQMPKVPKVYRQYSLSFKKKAVKALKEARGKHGAIKDLCVSLGVKPQHLYYWESRVDNGLLKRKNAVAFSRDPSKMIR